MSIISVLLLVLKYIGIILATLLGILILILLLLLFIPFRYFVYLSADGNFAIDVDVKIRWIFNWIYYCFVMKKSKKETKIFRVFSKKIINEQRRVKKESMQKDKIKKQGKTSGAIENIQLESKEEKKDDRIKNEEIETKYKIKEKSINDFSKENDVSKKVVKSHKNSLESEDVNKYNDIDEIVETDVIEEAEDAGFSLRNLLDYPNKKEIIMYTYQFLKKIFIHIRPRTFSSYLEFGLDDPSHTGYLLGAIGIISPFLGNSVHIKANFNEKILQGELEARGSFQIGIIIIYLANYLLKKPIREIVKNYLSS